MSPGSIGGKPAGRPDYPFLRRVVEDKLDRLVTGGVITPEDLLSPADKIFEFLQSHYETYGVIASPSTILEEFDVDLTGFDADEPVDFYLDSLKTRAYGSVLSSNLGDTYHSLDSGALSPQEAATQLLEQVQACQERFKESGSKLEDITREGAPEERVQEYMEAKESCGTITGVPSPWPFLDEKTLGWQGGDLGIILGVLGSGKTFALILMAAIARMMGFKVLFVSMEMGINSIAKRFDALATKVGHGELKRGMLDLFTEKRYLKGMNDLSKAGPPFWVAGNGYVKGVRELRPLILKTRPDIVLVDSFYKINGKSEAAMWERVSNSAWYMKQLAGEFDIPIVATSQFGRQVSPNKKGKGKGKGKVSRDSKYGSLQDVGYAYSMVQDADIVLSLNRDEDLKKNNLMLIRCLKVRDDEEPLDYLTNWDIGIVDFSVIGPVTSKRKRDEEDEEKIGSDDEAVLPLGVDK